MNSKKKKTKVCFAASTGGHFEQLMCLYELMNKYDSFIITEKTEYAVNVKGKKVYYLKQVNRKDGMWLLLLFQNTIASVRIYLKEKPDAVICTGVLSMIPICLLCKLGRKKLIYIESYAKSKSPTLSGKLLYHFADHFYVQWEEMLKIYPKARFMGGIY